MKTIKLAYIGGGSCAYLEARSGRGDSPHVLRSAKVQPHLSE